MGVKVNGVGTDAPVTVNDRGGKQSASPYRLDLLPPLGTLRVAEVLAHGAAKYGANNWHEIETNDHLNHALQHVFAHLAGDTQDDHLGHAACRVLMALDQRLSGRDGKPAPESGRNFLMGYCDDGAPVYACDPPPIGRKPAARKRVYIAGPISKGDLADNVNRATGAFLSLMRAGLAPFCPHWSVFAGGVWRPESFEGRAAGGRAVAFPERLPDGTTHVDWLNVDLPWVAASDAVLRLPGESSGADMEVAEATARGIPVFFSVADVVEWAKSQG